MLTGKLRNKLDGIWNAFWSGGIPNPVEVIEQSTRLLFLLKQDDLHKVQTTQRGAGAALHLAVAATPARDESWWARRIPPVCSPSGRHRIALMALGSLNSLVAIRQAMVNVRRWREGSPGQLMRRVHRAGKMPAEIMTRALLSSILIAVKHPAVPQAD